MWSLGEFLRLGSLVFRLVFVCSGFGLRILITSSSLSARALWGGDARLRAGHGLHDADKTTPKKGSNNAEAELKCRALNPSTAPLTRFASGL